MNFSSLVNILVVIAWFAAVLGFVRVMRGDEAATCSRCGRRVHSNERRCVCDLEIRFPISPLDLGMVFLIFVVPGALLSLLIGLMAGSALNGFKIGSIIGFFVGLVVNLLNYRSERRSKVPLVHPN